MLSLQDVLSMSTNPTEEELRSRGLLPQPAAPTPSVIGAVPATATASSTPIAKMTPPVLPHPNAAPHVASPNLPAPEVAPMVPPANADMGVKPMTLPALDFKQREALPSSSAGVAPGSSGFYENRIERIEDQKANPWGTAENHPGVIGKIGHVAGLIGNIAGNATIPGTMANIPGTEANRNVREAADENRLTGAKKEEAEETAIKQRPEMAEAAGALKERLEQAREDAAQKRTETGTTSKEKIAGEGNETKKEIATEGNETKQGIASERNKTQKEIEKERNESRERIATGHNLATTEAARIRAAAANDPDKLTNTMKTMKQQAQSTLPGIDRALDETEKVAGKLGPVAGRWNDFWQGKVGAEDKEFAHYKDEIAMVSSAVTLAHARGRMSNELFEHFEKMFDAGKQAPENMIQALNVAKEWLTEYAKMGEKPEGSNAPARPKGVPNEAVWNEKARQWQMPTSK